LVRCLVPSFEYPVPLQASVSTQSQCKGPQAARSLLVHDNGGGLRRHLYGWLRCARKLDYRRRARWQWSVCARKVVVPGWCTPAVSSGTVVSGMAGLAQALRQGRGGADSKCGGSSSSSSSVCSFLLPTICANVPMLWSGLLTDRKDMVFVSHMA
jgi:hypothetical protein